MINFNHSEYRIVLDNIWTRFKRWISCSWVHIKLLVLSTPMDIRLHNSFNINRVAHLDVLWKRRVMVQTAIPLTRIILVILLSLQVNIAATSAVKALEKPELLSPQVLQAGLHERVEKFMLSMQNSALHCGLQKANSPSLPTSSLDLHDERMDHR